MAKMYRIAGNYCSFETAKISPHPMAKSVVLRKTCCKTATKKTMVLLANLLVYPNKIRFLPTDPTVCIKL